MAYDPVYGALYRATHREQIAANNRAYRNKAAVSIRKYRQKLAVAAAAAKSQKLRYSENKSKISEYKRQYYIANREVLAKKTREYARDYYIKNKQKILNKRRRKVAKHVKLNTVPI